jgi:glycosyltransferase involved in cell wall biosynthesis
MSLTVIILARNESGQIDECLDSVESAADELLVVDDHSEDDTAARAEARGARVVRRRLESFAAQRNFALTPAAGDWVFFLDADERFSPRLAAACRRHMAAHPDRPGSVARRNFAFGRRHRFGPLKPDRVTRLFPRGAVRWEGEVHERPVAGRPALPLAGHLPHLTYRDWDHYLAKQFRYAALWAEEARARGRTASPLAAVLRAGAGFLKMLFLNLGLLGGPVTWALCWYHGAYTLTKYLKLSGQGERPGPRSAPASLDGGDRTT